METIPLSIKRFGSSSQPKSTSNHSQARHNSSSSSTSRPCPSGEAPLFIFTSLGGGCKKVNVPPSMPACDKEQLDRLRHTFRKALKGGSKCGGQLNQV